MVFHYEGLCALIAYCILLNESVVSLWNESYFVQGRQKKKYKNIFPGEKHIEFQREGKSARNRIR